MNKKYSPSIYVLTQLTIIDDGSFNEKPQKVRMKKKTRALITLINFLHFYCEKKFVFVQSKREYRTKETDNGEVTSARKLPRHGTAFLRDTAFVSDNLENCCLLFEKDSWKRLLSVIFRVFVQKHLKCW